LQLKSIWHLIPFKIEPLKHVVHYFGLLSEQEAQGS